MLFRLLQDSFRTEFQEQQQKQREQFQQQQLNQDRQQQQSYQRTAWDQASELADPKNKRYGCWMRFVSSDISVVFFEILILRCIVVVCRMMEAGAGVMRAVNDLTASRGVKKKTKEKVVYHVQQAYETLMKGVKDDNPYAIFEASRKAKCAENYFHELGKNESAILISQELVRGAKAKAKAVIKKSEKDIIEDARDEGDYT